MKKATFPFLILTLAAMIAAGCSKTPIPETADPPQEESASDETLNTSVLEEFALYAGTTAEAPLEGTVWACDTGEEYDRFIWFSEGTANLFYGYYDYLPKSFGGNYELQRWSDFYEAPYATDKDVITTNLKYPLWGETICTQEITVMKRESEFTIQAGKDIYTYDSKDPTTIESMWMIIYVDTPTPWGNNDKEFN